ncbi:hypothetical protein ACFL09_05740 [Planctomycetota bacterium]
MKRMLLFLLLGLMCIPVYAAQVGGGYTKSAADAKYVLKAGDTMTGTLTLSAGDIIVEAGGASTITQTVSNGFGLNISRDITETGSNPLVSILDDNILGTQNALRVKHDGRGIGINLTMSHVSAEVGLKVDSESLLNPGIDINGYYPLRITQDISNGTGIYVSRNTAEAGSLALIRFYSLNATDTQPVMTLRNSGSGPHITTGSTDEDLEISPNGTGSTYIMTGQRVNRTLVATNAYTVLGSDFIVAVNSNEAVTVTLPTVSATDEGKIYIVKDESGGASGNNITVTGEAGETIDGLGSQTLSSDYQAIDVYSNGTNWFIK